MKGLTITIMMILTVALMAGCCGGDSQACAAKAKVCAKGGACKGGKCGAGVATAAAEAEGSDVAKEDHPSAPDHPRSEP